MNFKFEFTAQETDLLYRSLDILIKNAGNAVDQNGQYPAVEALNLSVKMRQEVGKQQTPPTDAPEEKPLS